MITSRVKNRTVTCEMQSLLKTRPAKISTIKTEKQILTPIIPGQQNQHFKHSEDTSKKFACARKPIGPPQVLNIQSAPGLRRLIHQPRG